VTSIEHTTIWPSVVAWWIHLQVEWQIFIASTLLAFCIWLVKVFGKKPSLIVGKTPNTGEVESIVKALLVSSNEAQRELGQKDQIIQQLKQSVEAIQQAAQQGNLDAKEALQALTAQNDPRQAEHYFDQVIAQTQDAVLQQAAAYRHKRLSEKYLKPLAA
jgi:hypothetical protein